MWSLTLFFLWLLARAIKPIKCENVLEIFHAKKFSRLRDFLNITKVCLFHKYMYTILVAESLLTIPWNILLFGSYSVTKCSCNKYVEIDLK